MISQDFLSTVSLARRLEEVEEQGQEEQQEEHVPLPVPASFPAFPYPTPYAIQTQFMQQLFECIDQRKVGIFESPTGTGKSLSMICGAVSWLMDHELAEQERAKREQEEEETSKQGGGTLGTGMSSSSKKTSDDTPDWVQQHRATSDAAFERQEREARRVALEARVKKIRDREKKMRESMARKQKRQAAGLVSFGGDSRHHQGLVKKKKGQDLDDDDDNDDSEFLVDEYDSDDNSKRGKKPHNGSDDYGNVSKEVLELLKSFDEKEASHASKRTAFGVNDEDQEPDVLKIYYCSRTHSQLSQFVDELRKTSYGDHLHVISLGSRKSLCVNDRFRRKASSKASRTAEPVVSVNKLNDACLDAQKSGTHSDQRCEFLHLPSSNFGSKARLGASADDDDSDDNNNSDNISMNRTFRWGNDNAMDGDEKLLEFRDRTLARVRDIEELAQLGSELETCPYYGSRQTVRQCQLVTLPYNLLLHASTRESLKLVVKNNILLLDEAHNLINSLLQMHSVSLTLQQIVLAQDQLRLYLGRYEKRLSSTNEGYIRVLIRILVCLEGFIEKWKAGPSSSSSLRPDQTQQQAQAPTPPQGRVHRPVDRVMKVNEFLHDAGMDHINLFKAHAYLETSGVARKLQGLHEALQKKAAARSAKEDGKATVHIHTSRTTVSKSTAQQPSHPSTTISTTPILLTVDAFLMSLLHADNDGRIIVSVEEEISETSEEGDDTLQSGSSASEPTLGRARRPVLKFMLLNPANVFKPLVDEARSVVLAGGTMEPVSDLLSHLFPYLKKGDAGNLVQPGQAAVVGTGMSYPRIHRFTCGHVIPKENLLTLVMEKTPTGGSLELNFANRTQDQVVDGIGQSLVNVLGMIPDGVVVFFVSYSYMAQVLARWQVKSQTASGTFASQTILERIQARKRIFVEPREAAEADRLLKDYQDCIYARAEHETATTTGQGGGGAPRGAVLFSVVGGKMSEGINFSDRLGRGVVMVGMPFPNKGSAELQERMRYMDQVQQQELEEESLRRRQSALPSAPMRMTAGSEYYENLCMRAVNQSIGRAIRHQGDYAVIILMDKRYGVGRIRKKLPEWIGSSIEVCEQFGPTMTKLAGFFRTKRELAAKIGGARSS
ncbi:DEAD H (Asp-Glu-Ala-Asp His) box helicase 11 [Dissophora globulifera]|nr:DEAD H (Asp-Glu-Ala-Asp His) box helicase 11 [Dissophora globulifera]